MADLVLGSVQSLTEMACGLDREPGTSVNACKATGKEPCGGKCTLHSAPNPVWEQALSDRPQGPYRWGILRVLAEGKHFWDWR